MSSDIESADQQSDASDSDDKDTLSTTSRRALALLIDPNAGSRKLDDIAGDLGITSRMLYKIRRDPKFQDELREALLRQVLQHMGGVIDAAIQSARIVGREGHHDRKMLMALAGLIEATGKPKASGDGAQTIHNHYHLTERLARAIAAKRKLLTTVNEQIGDSMDTASVTDGSVVDADFDEVERGAI